MDSQTEIKNMLLKTGGKEIFIIRWQNYILPFCGYLAKEIYKQSIETPAWFLLAAYNKIREERNKFKKKLLSKKGTRT